jgi:osmotically-inducible protein OsmY
MSLTDQELRDGLQAFVNNAVTPSVGDVAVSVDHGVVTLTGRVATNTQRAALRDLVGSASGVRHVFYAVEVGASSQVHA